MPIPWVGVAIGIGIVNLQLGELSERPFDPGNAYPLKKTLKAFSQMRNISTLKHLMNMRKCTIFAVSGKSEHDTDLQESNLWLECCFVSVRPCQSVSICPVVISSTMITATKKNSVFSKNCLTM